MASIGITEIARRNAEPAAMSGETQSIFVAMTDIGLGDTLSAQVLKLEQWPKDKVPPGAISRIEDVEGRRARSKIYFGEPILQNRLLGKGASEQGATAMIPKGYRVVPVKVDLVTGGSSLILPGDRVDVMVHFIRNVSRDIPETVTRTILQDVKVFAVNDVTDLEKEKEGGKSITAKTISLLVTPDQAAKVMLAAQMGSVNLVMRSPDDDQQVNNAQARPRELFGGAGKANRGKESLMAEEDEKEKADEPEKGKSIVSFLNAIKEKAAANVPPVTPTPQPASEMWTMRVLKPGEVNEVHFELTETKDSDSALFKGWKSIGTPSGHQGDVQPGKAEPAVVAPPKPDEPAVEPAVEPATEPASEPTAEPTAEPTDGSASESAGESVSGTSD